jgi:uncharacterized protein (DUF1684 family)
MIRRIGPMLLLALVACGPRGESVRVPASAPAPVHDPELEVDVLAWRAERKAGLEQPDSWLTLVGLYWLKPGEATLGSDPSSTHVFPPKAPDRVGTIRLEGDRLTLRPAPRAGVRVEGEAVGTTELATDADGPPTVVDVGSLHFFAIDRGGKIGLRLRDSESSALMAFKGLDYFAVDAGWRLEARIEKSDPPKSIKVPNVLGQVSDMPSPGTLVFERAGRTFRLDPVIEEGDDQLFVIFGDLTNGKATYGGGRFLYADPPDADGRVILDFNRAYNPPCVFTPFATCPLPPPGNQLDVAVEAGEKRFAGDAH